MTNSFSILGLTFYLYGLIVGLAIWLGVSLIEKKAFQKKIIPDQISSKFFWQILGIGLLFGVIGARIWHVATDFYLYSDFIKVGDWWPVFSVWNGGLSILGGVAGGVLGAAFFLWWQEKWQWQKAQKKLFLILDLAVFGLPFGQVLGRFANFINQELYGLPSNLPWAIFIDLDHRMPGFEMISHYHPLFMYEAIFMIIFGVVVWKFENKYKNIGSGKYFLSYIIYYGIIRFFLDFLRIGGSGGLGILGKNQVILLVFLIVIIGVNLLAKKDKKL